MTRLPPAASRPSPADPTGSRRLEAAADRAGTDADVQAERLTGLCLPSTGSFRRDSILAEEAKAADFDLTYDATTLAYDCIHVRDRDALVLICPKLLNLEAALRPSVFKIDGTRARVLRLRKFRRYDEIWLRCDSASPETVTCEGPSINLVGRVSAQSRVFEGLRVICTKSRDNDLAWIRDWAQHHVSHQGTEAILFFDNGSTAYGLADLVQLFREVRGLHRAMVVSVPFRFGPIGRIKPRYRALFLQTGLLNLARYRFLHDARSVIHCDVDELAISKARTLHEDVEGAFWGYVTAPAMWRYVPNGQSGPVRHRDHVMRREPEAHTTEKWGIVPGGRLGGLSQDVHGVSGYLFNRFCKSDRHHFLHCRSISTNWRKRTSGPPRDDLVMDDVWDGWQDGPA